MIVFILMAITFGLPLVIYAPEPESLRKADRTTLKNRIRTCAGTLTLGLVLIMTAAAVFDKNWAIHQDVMPVFALSRQGIFEHGYVFQLKPVQAGSLNGKSGGMDETR